MKKIKSYIKVFFLVVCGFSAPTGFSQQTNLFNTYSYDLMQLNIAAIGRTCFEANINYRSQWQGMKDAPKLYQLDVAGALGKSHGLGLRVAQQNIGLLKFNLATLGYAYRVKLNEKSKLHLGVGASWQQNNLQTNKAVITDINDAALSNNQANLAVNNLDFEAGALFVGDKLTLGVSGLHLYNSNKKYATIGYNTKAQINSVLAYKFNKGKGVEIEPWLTNRYTVNGVNQAEGLLNFRFKQVFTIGAGYRLNYGVLALAGLELGKLRIAYSYDYSAVTKNKATASSHQILLGVDLCRKKAEKPVLPEPPKEPLYFISSNGADTGPYAMPQLQTMVKEGAVKRTTLIKTQATSLIAKAEDVAELAPLFPPKEPEYFVNMDGKEQGAYSITQLQNMVREGKIQHTTPVRNSNETSAIPAETMSELAPLFPPKEPLYYITIDGKEQGTYTMVQLQDMVKQGKILKTTLVRNTNATAGTNAIDVAELAPLFLRNIEEKRNVGDINAIALKSLQFGVGQSTLAGKGFFLDRIAEIFKQHPQLKVYLEGYASKGGSAEFNKKLAEKRTEFVRQELIKRGVNPANLLGNKAYGTDKVLNATDDSKNRAVHFEIVE